MDNRNEFIIKLIIFLNCIIYNIVVLAKKDMPYLILFSLVFLLNVQIRRVYLKNKGRVLSLLFDMFIIYIMFSKLHGLTYTMIFITTIDGISYGWKYVDAILLTTGALLLYFSNSLGTKYFFINISVYLCIIIFIFSFKKMSKKITEIEYLYDDIRRYSYELEKAKKQIEEYSNKVQYLTQMEERNRLSEEIHDTIGHRLTALLIQTEAGVRVIDTDKEKGKELLSASIENLRESIDELRNTVRRIKPKEYKNIILQIQDMIDKYKKSTGINITFEAKGDVREIYPGREIVLYKNTQEAITNSVRHGQSKKIDVSIFYKENEVIMRVKDDGVGCDKIKKGMGIIGMEERLKLVGGSLNIYQDNGFVVESIIPL